MKITWDNIDDFRLTRNKTFTKKYPDGRWKGSFVLVDECKRCSEPFFTIRSNIEKGKGLYCSKQCSSFDCNGMYGKRLSKNHIEMIKKSNSILRDGGYNKHNIPKFKTYHNKLCDMGVISRKNPYDKYMLEVKCEFCGEWYTPDKIYKVSYRIRYNKTNKYRLLCSDECKKLHKKKRDDEKYGKRYRSNNIPTYDTYSSQLEPYGIKCRRWADDKNVLEVKCMYCGRWYQPTRSSIKGKLTATKNINKGEQNLYCSVGCKKECPTYYMKIYPKDFEQGTSREVQPELRKMVFKRDDYTCQKCGQYGGKLNCHHIDPVKNNPIESADTDNCITLCINCHKEVHKLPECGTGYLSNCK